MAVDPKLVRRIEGTTGSPAAVQTKQHKFDVGDSGGRDRTEHIYKDAATSEHVFITKEHTEDLITDAISTSSSGGAFTVVTTEAELTTALENPLVLDIYCKRVSADISSTIDVDVQSSKNIYGGEGDLIFTGDFANYKITYPTSGGVSDIIISFYVPISHTGSSSISEAGGYVGSPEYKTRFGKIDKFGYGSGTNLLIDYESTDTDIPSLYASTVKFNLWSGRTYSGLVDSSTTLTPTEKNILATSKSTNPTDYTDYGLMARVTANATPGFETHSLDFLTSLDALNETQLKWTPFTGTYSKFETKLSNVLSSTLNSRGQLALGDFGLDPWAAEADVLQLGQFSAHYSFEDSGGDKRSGISQHCYASNNSGSWAFSTASVYAYREETVNGVTTVYVSDSTGSVDGTISLWNELFKRDERGNVAYNGATIPVTLSPLYYYEFKGNNSCIMRFKANGDVIYGGNCYFDGTNWLSIAAGESSRVEEQEIQDLRYATTVATGGSGSTATAPGQVLTMVIVYSQTYSNGNINIKSGGTYTATL